MPSKKSASEKPTRVRRAPAGSIPVLAHRSVRLELHAAGGKSPFGRMKGVEVRRNPWTPDDIVTLLKFVCTFQAAKYMYGLIKLWMEYRKAQKIEIRVGEYELKIEGHVSDKALEKKIERFKELIRGATYDDIEVDSPKGARRNIPAKLASKKAPRPGGK